MVEQSKPTPMRENATALAMAIGGGPARDDDEAVKKAYSTMTTLRSFGVELVSRADLSRALLTAGAAPKDQVDNLSGQVFNHLTSRY